MKLKLPLALLLTVLVGSIQHLTPSGRLPASDNELPLKLCGASGTIEERVKDCAFQNESHPFYKLVFFGAHITKPVIYLDEQAGILWAVRDFEGSQYDYASARALCASGLGLGEDFEIEGLTWKLPEESDFSLAETRKFNETRTISGFYWTSKQHPGPDKELLDYALAFNSLKKTPAYQHKKDKLNVSCVAELSD